jgi:cytochrome d ubiquinol oxidase subunit I
MAGLGAYYLLAGRDVEYGRIFLKIGVITSVIASIWMLFPSGHLSSDQVAEHQPVALAAMEGHFKDSDEADLVFIGQPNMERLEVENPIVLPGGLSLLMYGPAGGDVKSLEEFPQKNWPDNIPLLYYSYHVMVGLGTIFIAVTVLAAFMLWRGWLYTFRPMLWAIMLALPFPFIANTAGWFSAELGRQPWLAYGLFRTEEGVSPLVSSGSVLFTLIGFMGMYLIMGLLYVIIMVREVAHGPDHEEETLEATESLTA